MKKKLFCLAALTLSAMWLSACGSTETSDTSAQEIPTLAETEENISAADTADTSAPETEASEADTSETVETVSDASKTLVVYFSATGTTENAAKMVAKATDGDIFALIPETPYSADDLDWTDDSSRVSEEHNDTSKRNIPLETVTPENWDSYDTVFVGYPIWWGEAAYPVSTFVGENDFSDKTVIPFCTSSSSDIGDSGDALAQMAGSGNWLEGRRFSAGESEDAIAEWAKSFTE